MKKLLLTLLLATTVAYSETAESVFVDMVQQIYEHKKTAIEHHNQMMKISTEFLKGAVPCDELVAIHLQAQKNIKDGGGSAAHLEMINKAFNGYPCSIVSEAGGAIIFMSYDAFEQELRPTI